MPAGSPANSLPAHPHPDWYRKAAKKKLAELRAQDPSATLARAQLEIARANGFSSWRALIAAIATRQAAATSRDAVFEAIDARDHARLRALLAAEPALASAALANGRAPLHLAAGIDDVRAVELLLAHGADLEQRYGPGGHTPLSWAVTMGAFAAAAALLTAGAKSDLFCAAAMGDLSSVRSFFNAQGRVTADADYTGRVRFLSLVTPHPENPAPRDVVSDAMYAAVRHSRVDVAKFLLDRGVDLRARSFLGGTLLHWACYAGSRPIIDALLRAGADPDARDESFNCTPRAFAICAPARLGAVALVAARLAEDPSLATINEGRGTPLHEAVRGGHEAIVRLLIEHGADPGVRDQAGRVARDLADRSAGAWVEVLR